MSKPVRRTPSADDLRKYTRTSDRRDADPNDRGVDSRKVTKALRRMSPGDIERLRNGDGR